MATMAATSRAYRRVTDFFALLLNEVLRAIDHVRSRWREAGWQAYPLSIVAPVLIVAADIMRRSTRSSRVLDALSAVRLSQPVWRAMARSPLSLVAPAPRLPVWGAVAQVVLVVVLAEAFVGTRRTLAIAVSTQVLVNIIAHAAVVIGHASWLGITATHLTDRDTGPSVAVVAIGMAVAVAARAPILAGLLAASMAIETALLPDIAGHEHILGLLVGFSFGVVVVVRQRAKPTSTAVGVDLRAGPLAGIDRLSARRRRTWRVGAAITIGSALLALRSATTAPTPADAALVVTVLSLGAAQAAVGIVAASGIALLALAPALLRGQRRAWQLSLALMAMLVVGHIVKGADVEEAAATACAATALALWSSAFRGHSERRNGRHAIATFTGGLGVAFAAGLATVEVATAVNHHRRLPIGRAARAVASGLANRPALVLSDRVDDYLRPALFGAGIAITVLAIWRAVRPVVDRVVHDQTRAASDRRARELVAAHGGGTLDYFALRDDRTHFFAGSTLVSYAVYGTVCLVSPDPIGPVAERRSTWEAFHAFVRDQGWSVAVLGASREWLDVYRHFGMTSMYMGDEAVVDVATFDLGGGDRKSLRQAVNRVARHGYRVEFHDPAGLDRATRDALHELMAKSRRGATERGFSMTLGRLFDPRDEGLLLAVCTGPDGLPAAFCQFVPSESIGGWSLDLMRRDTEDRPNGLLDYVIVETIRHLAGEKQRSVALNFATMRAVLAHETGKGPWPALQRSVLQHLSADMQISSLWRFNAKYGPRWNPRYAVVDGSEHFVRSAVAIAQAESMWDLPLIGRFFAECAR